MPCSSPRCPGRPPYVLFPLTAGLPLMLLRKQPIWAAGDTPHLMPVEQGLPGHLVATGLAGQAIPFVVATSHAHALPSAPFWFPVPAVLVASPASLCPSSLFAVLALVPSVVAPAFCVSVLLLPLSVAPAPPRYRSPCSPLSHGLAGERGGGGQMGDRSTARPSLWGVPDGGCPPPGCNGWHSPHSTSQTADDEAPRRTYVLVRDIRVATGSSTSSICVTTSEKWACLPYISTRSPLPTSCTQKTQCHGAGARDTLIAEPMHKPNEARVPTEKRHRENDTKRGWDRPGTVPELFCDKPSAHRRPPRFRIFKTTLQIAEPRYGP